jgi:uncharacterized membrane protein YraQ (UPF0718 family)
MSPPPPRKRSFYDTSTLLVVLLSLWGAYVVYHKGGTTAVFAILHEDFSLFLTIVTKVLLGCLIGAFLTLLLPRDKMVKYVGGETGWRGLCTASIIGAILPSGPFTIFPLAVSFKLSGAGTGPVIAFITAWTLLGFNRFVVWEIPFFGTELVFTRLLFSLPLPLFAGYFAAKIEAKWF